MSFTISAGSEENIYSSGTMVDLDAAKEKAKACNCLASWKAFKASNSFDKYMSAHRVKAGKIQAVSPPGFGETIKHMQDHPQITNPYALAWFMKDVYGRPRSDSD